MASGQPLPSAYGNKCRGGCTVPGFPQSSIHKLRRISSFLPLRWAMRMENPGTRRAIGRVCELHRHQRRPPQRSRQPWCRSARQASPFWQCWRIRPGRPMRIAARRVVARRPTPVKTQRVARRICRNRCNRPPSPAIPVSAQFHLFRPLLRRKPGQGVSRARNRTAILPSSEMPVSAQFHLFRPLLRRKPGQRVSRARNRTAILPSSAMPPPAQFHLFHPLLRRKPGQRVSRTRKRSAPLPSSAMPAAAHLRLFHSLPRTLRMEATGA